MQIKEEFQTDEERVTRKAMEVARWRKAMVEQGLRLDTTVDEVKVTVFLILF